MRLRIAWATDPGLEREENEDSVTVWRNKAGLDTLIVVCDGMGGHAAGQHASSIAVKTVAKVLAEDGQEGPDTERLKKACKEANTAVFNAARDNPEFHRRSLKWLERTRSKGLPIFGQAATLRSGFAFTLEHWNLWDASPAWRKAPRPKPWRRCGPRSTTGDGPGSRSSCGPASAWRPAAR